MTAPLRALASAITTCLDAAKRALASANVADQSAKSASKSAQDAEVQSESVRATAAAVGANAADAVTAASTATAQAGIATTQATQAATAKTAAQTAQALAEAARDSVNTTGKVFADTASGIAGTTNGQTFSVLDASLLYWNVYKNNAGAAVLVASSYTRAYLDGVALRTTFRSWALVATGASGKLGWGLTNAGRFILGVGGDIVARITANETDIAGQKTQFVRSVRGSAFVWRVLDAAQTKVALAVDKAGNLIAKGRDVLAELDAVKLSANSLNASLKADGNAHAPRMAWVDSAGKSPLKASRSGRVLVWDRDVLKELDALNSAALGLSVPTTARENGAYIAVPFVDGAGKLQIRTIRKSDGLTVAVTSTGNNVGPALTSDNQVLFVSDAAGGWVQSYVPAAGGTVRPSFSTPDLVAWGDSLTAGAGSSNGAAKSYIAQLAVLLGNRSFFNGGIGGQTTPQIAARQGGAPVLVTVAGDQIPASGGVVITAKSVNFLVNSGTFSGSQAGTLAGVAGTMTTDAAGNWTFSRAANGAATPCPANTPFVPTLGAIHRGGTVLIMTGRNDGGSDPVPLLASIAAMLAYLTPYYKTFLIGLVLNSTTEVVGSGAYNGIKARNDAIKAAYPNNYWDTQSPPTADEMTALGFVPDATDTADIANGCIPTHMRNYLGSDTLHLNDTGYALLALRAQKFFLAKGW